MRTLSGNPQPFAPWFARQRRAAMIGGAALALALAALLIVRARSIANDPTVEVRLAGNLVLIDAPGAMEPELRFTLDDGSVHPIALLGVEFVPSHRDRAMERIAELLADNDGRVLATFDPALRQSPDAHTRWRAYVYLADARMVNEVLIAGGLVKADRSIPHVAARTLGQIESLTRRREIGLWADAPQRKSPLDPANRADKL